MAYLIEYAIVLPNWPSGSADLNRIENLWSIVKRRVEEQRPDSLEQVIALVFQVWESLEQSFIDSPIDSMSSRLQVIVHANGTYTVLMNRGNKHRNPTKFGKIHVKKMFQFTKINI
jgi:hypothetical protein